MTRLTLVDADELDALARRVAALEDSPGGGAQPVRVVRDEIHLFGPTQGNGAHSQQAPPLWEFPGSALTSSTAKLRCDLPLAGPIVEAVWVLAWFPNSVVTRARICMMDDGPSNIVELARLEGRTSPGPIVSSINVTNALEAVRRAGKAKNIGGQFQGDAPATFVLYESTIEYYVRIS